MTIGITSQIMKRKYNQDKAEPHEGGDGTMKDLTLSKGNTDNCDIFKDCEHGYCQVLQTLTASKYHGHQQE